MGRRLLSALAVAAVVAVAGTAAVDSFRNGEPRSAAPPAEPPPCREGQLALELVARDDSPVVVLRHARGPRCIAPDYEVAVEVAHGQALLQEGEPGGLFAPGVQWERTFRFQPSCDEQGPFSATVRIGPYSARGRVTATPCFRTTAEIEVFHRECVQSWNGGGNRANRAVVAAGRFQTATLFRSSNAVEVERCGLRLISPDFNRWLLVYRVNDRWWSIEQDSRAEFTAIEPFFDDRPLVVRRDGTLRAGVRR